MLNPMHYTYRVTWSVEDGEYVGLCAELPSLSHLAVTQADALTGISELVDTVVDSMVEDGEVPPAPISERHYT